MECQIQYVMEATVHQDATVDVKGNVKTTDPVYEADWLDRAEAH